MIVCSCAAISDRDITRAVVEIMQGPDAPVPTPGLVFRHLSKKMNCCSCAPVTIEAIYAAMDQIERDARISPYALAAARARLARIEDRRVQRQQRRNARASSTASKVA